MTALTFKTGSLVEEKPLPAPPNSNYYEIFYQCDYRIVFMNGPNKIRDNAKIPKSPTLLVYSQIPMITSLLKIHKILQVAYISKSLVWK